MSRRRKPPEDQVHPDQKSIRIVCTGRGDHREVSFGKLVVWPSESAPHGWWVMLKYADEGPDDVSYCVPFVRAQCDTCGRDHQMTPETVLEVFAGLAESNTLVLDISELS